MSVIENYPALRPSLLLDFANSGRVDPRISCTRASTATCYGPDGVLRTLANNVPRIDFDPVIGRCLGLPVEEARTNTGTPLIASGSVPQVPTYTYNADLPPLVAGRVPARNYAVGAVDATSAAGDRANIRGNPSGLTENVTYTASIYVCGVAGGATRATLYFGLAGMPTSQVTIDLVVGRWKRLTATFTLPAGVSGTGALRVAGSGGADPLQPFGADGYQFEIGGSASSLIPTTDVAVTRAAENAYIDVSADWYNPAGGTLFVEAIAPNSIQTFARLASLEKAGGVNVLSIQRVQDAVSGTARGYFEGASMVAGAGSFPPSVPVKVALAGALGDFALSASGSIFTSSVGAFGAPTQLRLGSSIFNSSHLNGHIQRVAYYPRRLTNAQLQRLTA